MSVSSSTVLAGWGDDGSFVVFFLDLKNNKPTTTHLNLYYKINTLVLYLSVKISVSLTIYWIKLEIAGEIGFQFEETLKMRLNLF